jgi:hypothetical protein
MELKPYLLEFQILGLPKMSNELLRGHWGAKRGHAARWKMAVYTKCWHLRPPAPLSRALVTVTRCSAVQPDFDGLVSAGKPLIDGLVQAKIIVDDNMSVIGQPIYVWEKCQPKKGHVKIKVESP